MKKAKKFASLILTFALIMQMIPGFTPHARAAIPDPNFELGLGFLLRGFNALADQPKEVIGINFNRGIFNNNAYDALREYSWYEKLPNYTHDHTILANSVMEYATKYGAETGVGGEIEFGKKDAFKLSLKEKWGKSAKGAMSEATETMFFQTLLMHREAVYDIDFYNIPEYVIQGQLTETFKNDLLSAPPEYVFNKYGTHFLTKYTLGKR